MDDTTQDTPKEQIPFQNLYLISGLVHGFNKSWMYITTTLLLIFGYLFFQSMVMYPFADRLVSNGYSIRDIAENANLLFNADALKLDRNLVILAELGMFLFAFIGFYAGIRYVHKKSLISILTGYEKFRLGRFFFGFAVWGGLLICLVLTEYFFFPGDMSVSTQAAVPVQPGGASETGGTFFNYTGLFISVLIMMTLMPIQSGLEEVIFRGYLIQGLSQVFRNGYLPLIITSLLFGLAHMSNPEVKAYGWPVMLAYFTSFALFMGGITLLDEGLELAFGIHFANNFFGSILVSSPNSVIKTYSIFETKSEDPYAEIWIWLCMATVTFVIFQLKYRWKNFSLIIK